jgi:RNase P subunit RPR2
MMAKKEPKEPIASIANRRIDRLLSLAREEAKGNKVRAARYVTIAKLLAARHRIPLGKGRKMLFCKKCLRAWIPGFNVAVRLRPGSRTAEYRCECGARRRFVYSKKPA